LGYFKDGADNDPLLQDYHRFIYKYLPELRKPMSAVHGQCCITFAGNEMIEKHKSYFF